MDNATTTHIYLTGAKRDEILRDATPEQKYILEMNERLQTEVRELRTSATEKDGQIEELEESSARDEKSKTYMRGLVVNYMDQIETHKEIQKRQAVLIAIVHMEAISAGERTRLALIVLQVLSAIAARLCSSMVYALAMVTVVIVLLIPTRSGEAHCADTPDKVRKEIVKLHKSLKDVDMAQEGLRQYLDDC